jgi:RNA polymerase sigma-70 factor (ECF subfamily)
MSRPEPALTSSGALLQRAQAGDRVALDALLAIYLPRMRRWASGRLPGTARDMLDTADVVQDTLVAALRRLDKVDVDDEGALQAYLRQALRNRLTDLYRRSTRPEHRAEMTTEIPASDPSPLERAIGAEAVQRYEMALERLSPVDRNAIILRIEMCCGYDEIAVALGKSSAAHARVAVSRALARLSREMSHARR